MAVDVERLAQAGKRQVNKMDYDDMAAMKLCLLSTGALVGLSLKGRVARRVAGMACTFLAAGLAIPLVSQFLDELEQTSIIPEDLEE